ncbi:alpha/beta fold hydrolase [Microtetraspora sp. NBRC 13810]|uniref:alpha/beta fold hydrolase n=1 Tax=Microtetraspora sp. NBRC 13810 TaxID=3030990 RepID=UPI0025570600|nr:alpha/beta fold hydrolase [Microtetraspora sp. NBRC 13810]
MDGYLPVPGARLYYEVRGDGPALLISQSGEGDAGRTADLVVRLADTYTVITYDRRGLSRSTLDDPAAGATMAEHADDVQRLLAQLTDGPAHMLGCSFGAVLGLHLAVRHPGRLATLIAHEPVAPALLPDADRRHHEEELVELQRVYRERGLEGAFGKIAEVLGIRPGEQEAEPDLTPHPMDDRRRANFDFFIRNGPGQPSGSGVRPSRARRRSKRGASPGTVRAGRKAAPGRRRRSSSGTARAIGQAASTRSGSGT